MSHSRRHESEIPEGVTVKTGNTSEHVGDRKLQTAELCGKCQTNICVLGFFFFFSFMGQVSTCHYYKMYVIIAQIVNFSAMSTIL